MEPCGTPEAWLIKLICLCVAGRHMTSWKEVVVNADCVRGWNLIGKKKCLIYQLNKILLLRNLNDKK